MTLVDILKAQILAEPVKLERSACMQCRKSALSEGQKRRWKTARKAAPGRRLETVSRQADSLN
jgi:hypothetical protein